MQTPYVIIGWESSHGANPWQSSPVFAGSSRAKVDSEGVISTGIHH